jgi:hypothetical protein
MGRPGDGTNWLSFHRDQLRSAKLSDNNIWVSTSDIATLIGIEFDENTKWGQLIVFELKLLIHLALQQFEDAIHPPAQSNVRYPSVKKFVVNTR